MRIGELAEQAGVTTKTIRFYETRGLLPAPTRTPSGYRDYDAGAVARLRFIRSAQAAGFTLREIAGILAIRDDGTAPCEHVRALIHENLALLEARLDELQNAREELLALERRARRVSEDDCPPSAICQIITPRGAAGEVAGFLR